MRMKMSLAVLLAKDAKDTKKRKERKVIIVLKQGTNNAKFYLTSLRPLRNLRGLCELTIQQT
jgi:hypothetical protein